MLPEANSAKGARLPHRAYVDALVALQHRGLVAAKKRLSSKDWDTASEVIAGDLHMALKDVIDADALASAYANTLEPQLAIAKAIGFESDWRFAK